MKNYYEILEVDIHASQEVIEKAYKALVKKYHPDLQPDDKKADAENKIKIINEAYDILSNKEKRETYDIQLQAHKQREEQQKYQQTNINYQNNTAHTNNYSTNTNYENQYMQKRVIKKPSSPNKNIEKNYDLQDKYNQAINDAYSQAYSKAYQQAYINTLKNMGYKIKYEKTFKDYVRNFLVFIFTIIFIIIICFILWHIPFTKNYLLNLYNNNEFIRIFVDMIRNIISNFLEIF